MTVHVITQCTARKADTALRAVDLYQSRPHRILAAAFRRARMRGDVVLWVVSAKYGLVRWDQVLAPYDKTFANMAARRLVVEGERMGLPAALNQLLQGPGLKVVGLGAAYLRACALDRTNRPQHGQSVFVLPYGSRRAAWVRHSNRVVYKNSSACPRYSQPSTGLKQSIMAAWLDRGPTAWAALSAHVRRHGPVEMSDQWLTKVD